MFRKTLSILTAGALSTLAACHQAKPAATPYEAQAAATEPATADRSARDAAGFAPTTRPAQPVIQRWPAPAPEPTATSTDDPLRVLELP